MEDKIHVCYAISDKNGGYTKVAGTSICSLLANTDEKVVVHILHDTTLNNENAKNLQELTEKYFDGELQFHDVSGIYHKIWDDIKSVIPYLEKSRLSIATFFRLILGELFTEKIERLIYLDADTIVNRDIKDLWGQQVSKYGVAAAPNEVLQACPPNMVKKGLIEQSEYYNAGVLLLDIAKFSKKSDLVYESLNFLKRHNPEYLDQDILNYFFPKSCLLTSEFNAFVNMERNRKQSIKPYIYHYVNNCIGMDMTDGYNELYFRYFSRTPWCNEIFIGNLQLNIGNGYRDVIENIQSISNICAGKKRFVIGIEKGKNYLYNLLKIKKEEIYIPIESIHEFEIKFNKEKDVFLIFLEEKDYQDIKRRLEFLGLKENTNFVNGMLLVTNGMRDDYKLFMNS